MGDPELQRPAPAFAGAGDRAPEAIPEPPAGPGLVLCRLAELPGEALVDADALGGALAVSARTVQRLVGQGHLPPGVELGGRTVWIVGRVLAWLAGRAEQAEKKAARFSRNSS